MAEEIKELEQVQSSLQQLLDSKYPLLQEFREACPGTHKHSQGLAGMVESVALELDLNVEFILS